MKIKLIIAIGKNGVMGIDNKLPWKLKDDLKHFKKITNSTPLIMGTNTFNSLPGILPGREHLVLSNTLFGDENKSVFTSIKEVLEYVKDSNYSEVFVIGGSNVIKQFIKHNLFDELIITHVDCDLIGDTYITNEDLNLDRWDIYNNTQYYKDEFNDFDFKVCKYIKKKKRFH